MSIFSRKLNADRAVKLVNSAMKKAETDSKAAAWLMAQPLLRVSEELYEAADGLVYLINQGVFERYQALEAAAIIVRDYSDNPGIMGRLGQAFEELCDIRYLNAAPPKEPVLVQIAEALLQLEQGNVELSEKEEVALVGGLSTAARVLGRTWDEAVERCAKRLVELKPDHWGVHYDLGLFYKTRGRFEEGCAANQEAFDRGGAENDPVQWNLGICATGAGDGERALKVWKSFGHKIEIGRFDLPDGLYDDVKVRLAERPLAERSPAEEPDDPGLEETIWVERVSPCHGVIRSALVQDLGVDYGDVVLFDGAPITFHEYDGERVPVFPHLATIARPGYLIFPFGGTQECAEQIAELSRELPADAVLYTHTEQFRVLCQECWEEGRPHQHKSDEKEHRVVTGKLCAPPDIEPGELLAIIDRVVAEASGVQLFIPDLAEAAGDHRRAQVEGRRLAMMSESS